MGRDSERFLDELAKEHPDCVSPAKKLIEWFRTVEGVVPEITPDGWYAFNYEHPTKHRHPYHVCYLTRQGEIKIHIKRLYWRGKPKPDGQRFPPFDDDSKRAELGSMLQRVTRTPPPPKTDGICSFDVTRLDDEEGFDRFSSVIEWMIDEVRKS